MAERNKWTMFRLRNYAYLTLIKSINPLLPNSGSITKYLNDWSHKWDADGEDERVSEFLDTPIFNYFARLISRLTELKDCVAPIFQLVYL